CNEPKEDEKNGSMKVVKYCRGHPLAIKVLGSSVRNEDATMEDILESLGKEINPDIKKVLRISFDSLPYEKDKELFKHIACFFVGGDKKLTEEILRACGICKSSGIMILINRSLLTLVSNKLVMHQLLQDMGRDLVLQESPKKPWKRSLLWNHEECLDVLQNGKGTTRIKGLVLDMNKYENETFSSGSMSSQFHNKKCGFETLAIREMRNLRLLQLNYVELNGSYNFFPEGLRWLCMHGFPLSYIPSDLPMQNMVALDMSNSKLQQLWKEPKLLRSLKFLNLKSCFELVSVGPFSGLPALENLILERCTSLVEVCESIGTYCGRLEVLDMSECKKLKKLPNSIGKLKNLTKLVLDGCSNLAEFPVEMMDMESLKVLMADKVNKVYPASSSAIVKAIPRTLKTFQIFLPHSLVSLSLRNNNLFSESFPNDFSSLAMLKYLHLDDNPIESLPDCVRSLSRLEDISFARCRRLKTVLGAPSKIKYLLITDCFSLEKVTFHQEMSALPCITYFRGECLTEIEGKFKLQGLSEISEEMLCSLGWMNIEYLRYYNVSMADSDGNYRFLGKIIPKQMLYEHGIFSTYLSGQEVPKWFTHRSNEPSFTVPLSPKNCRICGLNLCIVSTMSNPKEVGPSRVEIRNLTKNRSWTYQPILFALPADPEFEYGDDVEVWLSHWMFGKNEFEDGDQVTVHFSKKFNYFSSEDDFFLYYTDGGTDCANVREYGISLVYDDGIKKEDPLAYYKSWNHIISRDLSAAKMSSGNYLLKQWREHPDV
ncbi:Toll/interleukin-1 receptor domain-containing protein, partial [Tanacetum coccineum]